MTQNCNQVRCKNGFCPCRKLLFFFCWQRQGTCPKHGMSYLLWSCAARTIPERIKLLGNFYIFLTQLGILGPANNISGNTHNSGQVVASQQLKQQTDLVGTIQHMPTAWNKWCTGWRPIPQICFYLVSCLLHAVIASSQGFMCKMLQVIHLGE